jgi:hypothetical protein
VALFAIYNFRSNVIWRATDCPFPLPVEINISCESEVTYLDLHLIIDEEIAELEVSMCNTLAVDVLHSFDNLTHVAFNFELMQSFSSFK